MPRIIEFLHLNSLLDNSPNKGYMAQPSSGVELNGETGGWSFGEDEDGDEVEAGAGAGAETEDEHEDEWDDVYWDELLSGSIEVHVISCSYM